MRFKVTGTIINRGIGVGLEIPIEITFEIEIPIEITWERSSD